MKKLNLVQGSHEWLEFRRFHVMATDAACIMKDENGMPLNPFKNSYELYMEKMDGITTPENDHMRRGQAGEPLARQLFIEQTCIDIEPMVVQSSEFPFMAASLDGIDQTHKIIVEIKCPASIQKHLSKEIPIHYKCQMMHQLAVTQADCCFFISYHADDPEKIIVQEMLPDKSFIEEMIEKERYFYEVNMCQMKAPEQPWKFTEKK